MTHHPHPPAEGAEPSKTAALAALEDVIPPHLRSNRHGEGFLGERYEILRAFIAAVPEPCLPGRHCERAARNLGGCIAGECNRPASTDGVKACSLTDAQIVEVRDSCLPSQGEPFDCIKFSRAILAAASGAEGRKP